MILDEAKNKTLPKPHVKGVQTVGERRVKYDESVKKWTDKLYPLHSKPVEVDSPPCDAAPESMQNMIDTYIAEVDKVLARLRDDEHEWVPYNDKVIHGAGQLAFHKQTDFPRLEFTMALHGRFFLQSRDWDRSFSNFLMAVHECLGCGSGILRRLVNLVEAGVELKLDSGTHEHLRWTVFRLRQMYDQATRLGQLSLTWRNRCKDRFRQTLVEFTLEELVEIGGMLETWIAETGTLYEQLEHDSFEQWIKAGLSGFLRDRVCYFSYGNPLPYSFNAEAKAELSIAREVLANRSHRRASDADVRPSIADAQPVKRRRPAMKRPPEGTSPERQPTGGQSTTEPSREEAGPILGETQKQQAPTESQPTEGSADEPRERIEAGTEAGQVSVKGVPGEARGDQAEAGKGDSGGDTMDVTGAEGEQAAGVEGDAEPGAVEAGADDDKPAPRKGRKTKTTAHTPASEVKVAAKPTARASVSTRRTSSAAAAAAAGPARSLRNRDSLPRPARYPK
ncbi:hypothetical protein FS749_009147 [Ceratobasidium sp. UAMH 11750]|nr:hypothetical protein FS749_009147 [Ceratobasidium sp. UAMH 11750]